MYDFQSLIFRSASHWSIATALVVFGAGLLYTLQGYRFARFLVPASGFGGGLLLGSILAKHVGLPLAAALIPAGVLGTVGLARYRWGLLLASAFTLGALAQYLGVQIGLEPNMTLISGGLGFAAGVSLLWVCRRNLPILLTVVQGSGLLMVGFVGITSALAPTLGATFREWTEANPLMAPAFILMLCVMGYSVQANAYRGDITSGGGAHLHDLEAS